MIETILAPYDYDLPEERVAVHPLLERSSSKMMILPRREGDALHSTINHLVDFLEAGDVLVLNNTKVLNARVQARRKTGGKVEVFFLHEEPSATGTHQVLLKPSRRLKVGERLDVLNMTNEHLELIEQGDDGEWTVRTSTMASDIMKEAGVVPIPPYLRRDSETADQSRYQTVFAKEKGAVAAPTAGLHFTPEVLSDLTSKGVHIRYVTLHVGIGTFRNLRAEDLERNKLHSEWFSISSDVLEAIAECRKSGGKVFACGTTVTRCLESAFTDDDLHNNLLNLQDKLPISGYTNIFIREGFQFRVVDGLLTNFHLPKSSLLMLVSAFAGRERVMKAYHSAIANEYRFFSYGDAMLIVPSR